MGALIASQVCTSTSGTKDVGTLLESPAIGRLKFNDTYRRFFGEPELNAEPMISGFGIAYFIDIPPGLIGNSVEKIDNTELNQSPTVDANTIADTLTALVTSFDLPDMTYDVISYDGRDGGQWHVPGAIKMGGDLSINFWELRGLPIYYTLSKWAHIMRNPHYGFMTDYAWRQQNYKGKLLYVACTPDLEVQSAKIYSGIWPTDVKDSVLKYDNNQEKVEISATFKFDHYPYSSAAIHTKAQNMVIMTSRIVRANVDTKYGVHENTISSNTGAGVGTQTGQNVTSSRSNTNVDAWGR